MSLAVLGISHHTAPVEIRERLAYSEKEAAAALDRLREEGEVREGVLLSTCNRTELYLYPLEDGRVIRLAERMFAERGGVPPRELRPHLYRREGAEAVRQLFRVTAGLDSMVLGEAEIQGQVRAAYRLAAEVPVEPPMVGPVLARLFETALAVGGRVRSETEIGAGAASVPSVAVELARKIFGSLKGRRALILGAGEMGELTVRSLVREGVRGVVVANRTFDRARDLSERLGVKAVNFGALAGALRETDLVVASTAAPHQVLTLETFREAFPEGPARPFFIIDIALPRDVDPSIGDEPNVFLYNIDDLRKIVDDTLERRRGAVPAAEAIVEEGTEEFQEWFAGREVVPVIRSLRARGEEIRRAEVERALRRLGHLDPRDRAAVEELSRRLLNKLLHSPTARLREGAANGRGPILIDVARFLFELEAAEDED